MTYTPGPWRFGPRSKTNLYAEDTGQYLGTFLRLDDARLCRAAPYLFEALEHIASETWMPAIGASAKSYAELHEVARRAIDEVLGKQEAAPKGRSSEEG